MTTLYNGDDIDILIRAIEELEKKGYKSDREWNKNRINEEWEFRDSAQTQYRKTWCAWLIIYSSGQLELHSHNGEYPTTELTPDNFTQIIASFPNLKTV